MEEWRVFWIKYLPWILFMGYTIWVLSLIVYRWGGFGPLIVYSPKAMTWIGWILFVALGGFWVFTGQGGWHSLASLIVMGIGWFALTYRRES